MRDNRSIVVRHVSKTFTLRYHRTVKQMSVAMMRQQELSDSFLAVDDVSFTVEAGRVHRPDGPQRLGQEHAAQDDQRDHAPRLRQGADAGPDGGYRARANAGTMWSWSSRSGIGSSTPSTTRFPTVWMEGLLIGTSFVVSPDSGECHQRRSLVARGCSPEPAWRRSLAPLPPRAGSVPPGRRGASPACNREGGCRAKYRRSEACFGRTRILATRCLSVFADVVTNSQDANGVSRGRTWWRTARCRKARPAIFADKGGYGVVARECEALHTVAVTQD